MNANRKSALLASIRYTVKNCPSGIENRPRDVANVAVTTAI